MRRFWFALLPCLLPAPVFAGAQYTAEDVIRYFEQANAEVAPAAAAARTGSATPRGIVIGDPAAPAPKAAARSSEDTPLAIPMTGAKAGHGVAPAQAVAEATAAAGPVPGGYDLMVTFELDSATLTPQARQNLDAFARALASPALSGLRFAVEGHTDATGSAQHNLELSERRAASAMAYLVAHGVSPDRLTAHGYGETRPRLADPEHPANRRVETRRLN